MIRSIFTSVPVPLVVVLALSLGQIPRTSPEKLWGQVVRERAKLIEVFDSDVEDGRARPKDWDGRIAVLKKKTATTLTSYNVMDWKDEQLIFLSWLYDFVEKPSEKAQCLEAFLSRSTRAPQKAEALAVLVQTYVDLDRIDDAVKGLEKLQDYPIRASYTIGTRVTAHRAAAYAVRDKGNFASAARIAAEGFDLAERPELARDLGSPDARSIEAPRLAALAIDALQRQNLNEAALALEARWNGLKVQLPGASSELFASELASARLLGRPVPAIRAMRWLGGGRVIENDYRGKITLIQFWAMWSEDSVNQMEKLNEWMVTFADKGLQVVGVTRLFGRSDKDPDLTPAKELQGLEAFLASKKVKWPVALLGQDDTTNDDRFAIAAIPTLIVVDRSGMVRSIKRGPVDSRLMVLELARLAAK